MRADSARALARLEADRVNRLAASRPPQTTVIMWDYRKMCLPPDKLNNAIQAGARHFTYVKSRVEGHKAVVGTRVEIPTAAVQEEYDHFLQDLEHEHRTFRKLVNETEETLRGRAISTRGRPKVSPLLNV